MALNSRLRPRGLPRPPAMPGELGLQRYLDQIRMEFEGLPLSYFSTSNGPNESGVSAPRGTIGIEIGSGNTALWFKADDSSFTQGWTPLADGDALTGWDRGSVTTSVHVQSPHTVGIRNSAPEAALHVGDGVSGDVVFEEGAKFEASSDVTTGSTRWAFLFRAVVQAAVDASRAGVAGGIKASHSAGTVKTIVGGNFRGINEGGAGVENQRGVSAIAWAVGSSTSHLASIYGSNPLNLSSATITNAYTEFLQAPSSVGDTKNVTLWADDPAGTGANTFEAESGAKLTTAGVWTDAPSFTSLKQSVETISGQEATSFLRSTRPIRYSTRTRSTVVEYEVPEVVELESGETVEQLSTGTYLKTIPPQPGIGFALDELPQFENLYRDGISPTQFGAILAAGWKALDERLKVLEGIL